MIIVATITAAILMVWFFFRAVTTAYTREAVITGIIWLVVNWALDLIVLVSLLGMTPLDYVTRIGLRYLMIPAMVAVAGIIADDAALRHKPQYYPRGPIMEVYSAFIFTSIRKNNPVNRPDRNLIHKRSTLFYKGAGTRISYTA
jgi:hypothetical protein